MSYASLLRAAPPVEPAAASAAPPRDAEADADAGAAVFEELALLRMAALEAFERASARLLRSLADEVLGRELALAPHDIEALAARALAELRGYEPLALVLSPGDAARVRVPVPVRIDPALRSGDAVVEVRDGALESPAAFRLEALLARVLRNAA